MATKLPPIDFCRSCNAAIYRLKHVKTGNVAPIDAACSADGNIIITAEEYTILLPSDRAPYAGQLHKSHVATCPQAAQHHPQAAHGLHH